METYQVLSCISSVILDTQSIAETSDKSTEFDGAAGQNGRLVKKVYLCHTPWGYLSAGRFTLAPDL